MTSMVSYLLPSAAALAIAAWLGWTFVGALGATGGW